MVSAFIVHEQLVVFRWVFLLLKIVIRQHPIPRVSHDSKLIVARIYARIQFLRVTGNVLVIMPVLAEEFLDAFAGRFRNMDKYATILVIDHT